MAGLRARDDGFSLIEVVFAAFVAFVVLTAIFSMIIVSGQVNRVSRTDAKATTLANLLIEQARSLSYANVGILGGDPPGLLVANETTTYAGVSYQIEREVTWVDDDGNGVGGLNGQDFKQLSIRVRWGANNAGLRYVTFIRDRAEEAFPPTVTWINVPDADVIIFNPSGGSQAFVWNPDGGSPDSSNGAVNLQASVSATGAAGVITRVEFWTETRLMPNGAFQPSGGTMDFTTPVYAVDSRAVDASGVAYLPDGFHTIKCEAWTASGLRDFVSWSFMVDNFPPVWDSSGVTLSEPGPARNQDRYNGRVLMSWGSPNDGGMGVTNYVLYLAQNNSTSYASYPLAGPAIPYLLATGAPSGLTVEPFNAYKVYLAAKSPRGLLSNSSASAWAVSNPRLTGTIRNNATKKIPNPPLVTTLSVTAPAAGALAAMGATSVKYDVYEATAWTSGTDLATKKSGYADLIPGVSAGVTNTNPVNITVSNPGVGKYYQVEAKLYNAAGTLVASVKSNVIGVTAEPRPLTTDPIPVP